MSRLRRLLILKKIQEREQKHNFLNDKTLLPNPFVYYSVEFPQWKPLAKRNWQVVKCCFHDDSLPSLSFHLIHGGFHCFACGAKGGDIISFHRLRYGLSFKETVKYFLKFNS
jgi:hypothetical protein